MNPLDHLLPTAAGKSSNEIRLRREVAAVMAGFGTFLVPALVCTGFLVDPSHLATALLWALATFAVAASAGFLFGIPHVMNGGLPGSVKKEAHAEEGTRYRQHASTSLEQIADWLTKAIVGVTLVELRSVVHFVWRMARIVGDGIGGATTTQPAALAILLCFGAVGFLGGYLLTRLYLSGAFGLADQIATLPITESERAVVSAAAINIQTLPGNHWPTLHEAAPAAVRSIAAATFESLSRPEDMVAWAKVQLEAGNASVAVPAYAKALALRPGDERFRFEHAVAMARAGYSPEAVATEMRAALELVSQRTDRDLAKRIVTNLVFQCLYLPPPKGFSEAIRIGQEYLRQSDHLDGDGALFVNLACAYGQKVRWLEEHKSQSGTTEEIATITQQALEAARSAVSLDFRWKDRLRALMSKDDSTKPKEDDDLEVFSGNLDFEAVVSR